MEKIIIANSEYYMAEPTFAVLDNIKQETGFDFAMGITHEKTKEALAGDIKKLPRLIAILTQDSEDEGYDEKRIMQREAFFYKHGKLSDFKRAMDFFLKVLTESATDSSGQHLKKKDPRMKLVKTK